MGYLNRHWPSKSKCLCDQLQSKLTLLQRGTEFGEIMFSLSYLPTAERLTVVVVKARNLKFQAPTSMEVFVKVSKYIKEIFI